MLIFDFKGFHLACYFNLEVHHVLHFDYIPVTYKDLELQVLI